MYVRTSKAALIDPRRSALSTPLRWCLDWTVRIVAYARQALCKSPSRSVTMAIDGHRTEAAQNGHGEDDAAQASSDAPTADVSMSSAADELTPLGLNRFELVRLIARSLDDLGYSASARQLEEESGILALPESMRKLRSCVLEGRWDELDELFSKLDTRAFASAGDAANVRFHLYAQKFLELLENRQAEAALECLRKELAPGCPQPKKLGELALLVMCQSVEQLHERAKWPGAGAQTRLAALVRAQRYLSPAVVLAEHRLESLLLKALEQQKREALFPYTKQERVSLLEELEFAIDKISRRPALVLNVHEDEVWFVKFSHDGRLLASASKDNQVIVWNVDNILAGGASSQTQTPTHAQLHVLWAQQEGATFLSFSPDDRLLLSCGNNGTVLLWNMEDGELLRTFKKHIDAVCACAWLDNGRMFVSAGADKDKNIHFWSLESSNYHCVHTISTESRIYDLGVTEDGKTMVTVCSERKIHVYDVKTRTELYSIVENDNIMSLCLLNERLLLNLSSQNVSYIHEWDLRERRLIQNFRGQTQKRYVIRSCYGGQDNMFVLSGSEDNKVYLWDRASGRLLTKMEAHTGMVNSVSWNPTNPHMFASASDDRSVIVWLP